MEGEGVIQTLYCDADLNKVWDAIFQIDNRFTSISILGNDELMHKYTKVTRDIHDTYKNNFKTALFKSSTVEVKLSVENGVLVNAESYDALKDISHRLGMV